MSKPKKPFRKRHLFARSVNDVVKEATKPLMSKQGKLYGALLRDWPQIVGDRRAAVTRPQRLQFPTSAETSGATLHLHVKPSAAPELSYELEQMLEQCARYFGYRAINRIVVHAEHGMFDTEEPAHEKPVIHPASTVISTELPKEMRAIFERMANHLASASDKKN